MISDYVHMDSFCPCFQICKGMRKLIYMTITNAIKLFMIKYIKDYMVYILVVVDLVKNTF